MDEIKSIIWQTFVVIRIASPFVVKESGWRERERERERGKEG